MRHRFKKRDTAAPVLLPTFFAATLVIVAAVIAMARIDNDAADFAAIALVVVTLGLLMREISRQLAEDEPGSSADGPEEDR
jgi:hypothetical protein